MFETIACGADGSPSARHTLTVATGLARALSAKLVIIHVQEVTISRAGFLTEDTTATLAELRRSAERLQQEGVHATVRWSRATGHDTPRTILDLARHAGADVLVVSNRGHGPLTNFALGSVATRLLQFAPCPVILVPSRTTPEHHSPMPTSNPPPRGPGDDGDQR